MAKKLLHAPFLHKLLHDLYKTVLFREGLHTSGHGESHVHSIELHVIFMLMCSVLYGVLSSQIVHSQSLHMSVPSSGETLY